MDNDTQMYTSHPRRKVRIVLVTLDLHCMYFSVVVLLLILRFNILNLLSFDCI